MPKRIEKKHRHTSLHQVGALPIREHAGSTEVCLITTRETGRWTIPKGWPMKGCKDPVAARIEAEQEAGIIGKIDKDPFGTFLYWKRRCDHFDLVTVHVFLLHATEQLDVWKELGQRQIRWVAPADAAIVVEEPGLATLLQAVTGMSEMDAR